jgi:urea transport system permease protein
MTEILPGGPAARVENFQPLETSTRDSSNDWNSSARETAAAPEEGLGFKFKLYLDPPPPPEEFWAGPNAKKDALFPLKGRAVAPLFFLAALILVPVLHAAGAMPTETVNMFGRYTCFAIVALGLDLIWGYTGILSLCQSMFFAFGGYAMGMHLAMQGKSTNGIPECLYYVYPYAIGEMKGHEVLPWYWEPFRHFAPAVILAMLAPAAFAALIGFFGFKSRVRGVYFSILTQALTVAAAMFFGKNELKFCGTNGITHFETILGFDLTHPHVKVGLFIVSVLALAAAYGFCKYIVKSRAGRVLVAIRDSEGMLRFSGYQPYLYKVFVFAVAAGIAGLAGMLYAPQAMIINPSSMEAKWSILIVIWVAVGGRGTLSGAVFGALAVNLLYNFLTSEQQIAFFHWKPAYWPFFLGVMFVTMVLKFPTGLVPAFGRVFAGSERRTS